jgi:hypothetical protein
MVLQIKSAAVFQWDFLLRKGLKDSGRQDKKLGSRLKAQGTRLKRHNPVPCALPPAPLLILHHQYLHLGPDLTAPDQPQYLLQIKGGGKIYSEINNKN